MNVKIAICCQKSASYYLTIGCACFCAFGTAIVDAIVEPARAKLLPHFHAVKQAALDTGGFGCSISGSGPTIFAVTNSVERGETIGKAMRDVFQQNDLACDSHIVTIDQQGAKKLPNNPEPFKIKKDALI